MRCHSYSLTALHLQKESPVLTEWEAGWSPDLVLMFLTPAMNQTTTLWLASL